MLVAFNREPSFFGSITPFLKPAVQGLRYNTAIQFLVFKHIHSNNSNIFFLHSPTKRRALSFLEIVFLGNSLWVFEMVC